MPPLTNSAHYRLRAAQCRLAAARARAPLVAQLWLQQERRWLMLAADCDGLDDLTDALAEAGDFAHPA